MAYETADTYETDIDAFDGGEFENEYEYEYEYPDDEGEFEFEEEFESEYEGEWEVPFDESEEMDLAAELLDVSDDAELEYFLGGLIKKAASRAGKFLKSKTGRALKGVLKTAAKRALPIVGGAVGRHFGGRRGGQIGSQLASRAGRFFGLELEGLSPEDQEFEAARRFVRLASSAAVKAPDARTGSAVRDAKVAVAKAARTHAPGLVRPVSGPPHPQPRPRPGGQCKFCSAKAGRWVRRGRNLVLLG